MNKQKNAKCDGNLDNNAVSNGYDAKEQRRYGNREVATRFVLTGTVLALLTMLL